MRDKQLSRLLPLKRVLNRPPSRARLDRIWSRLEADRSQNRSRRYVIAGVAAAGVLLVGLAALLSPDEGALRTQQGSLPGGFEEPRDHLLSDRSWIRPGFASEVAVERNDGEHFDLTLSRGDVEVEVTPGGPRRWTVDAGGVTVEVVGTRFIVERGEHHRRVQVLRGRVLVRGEWVSTPRMLTAGETLELQVPPTVAAAEATRQAPENPVRAVPAATPTSPSAPAGLDLVAPDATGADAPIETEALQDPAALSRRLGTPSPESAVAEAHPLAAQEDIGGSEEEWHSLLGRGELDGAWEAVGGTDGVASGTRRATSPQELLALADVARRSGHPRAALAPLEELTLRFEGQPDGALGALTLGRVRASLGDAEGAAEAFELAARSPLPDALRSDALGRQADALLRSGRRSEARGAAARYLREFPAGLRAEAMRGLLDAP